MADTINDERQSLILPRPNVIQCCQDPVMLDLTLLCHVELVVPGILGAQLGRIGLWWVHAGKYSLFYRDQVMHQLCLKTH